MLSLSVRSAQVTYPTGNPEFSVLQAFPAAFNTTESDPFLMLDHFEMVSSHQETDPDVFPVGWHPHRGFDLLTYLVKGVGRHADSMGNRETFSTPGCQWISAGSGIEHAEAGGTPVGEMTLGFQIWINVPSDRKMDDPRYGTHPTEEIPVFAPSPGVSCRLVAGSSAGLRGPFTTVQDIALLDFSLSPLATVSHPIPPQHDNALLYCYEGSGVVGGMAIKKGEVARLDAADETSSRDATLKAGDGGMGLLLFSGKRLDQPVAWRGPFVMTTQAELSTAMREYRDGTFLKKRAPWDFKKQKAADEYKMIQFGAEQGPKKSEL